MNAELLMLAGGVTAFALTVGWVRTRALGERDALAWLAVATLLLLCGLFPRVVTATAEWARLSYPAAVVFVALAVIYLFAMSVSVALTRLQRRTGRLVQEAALLAQRVAELERAAGAGPPAPPAAAPPP